MSPSNKYFEFVNFRTIKEDDFYMFPRWGFTVYESLEDKKGYYINTDPFTRSLDSEYFNVVKVHDNGLCEGNFLRSPHKDNFYISKFELSRRDLFERGFIKVFVLPFLMIRDIIRGV